MAAGEFLWVAGVDHEGAARTFGEELGGSERAGRACVVEQFPGLAVEDGVEGEVAGCGGLSVCGCGTRWARWP